MNRALEISVTVVLVLLMAWLMLSPSRGRDHVAVPPQEFSEPPVAAPVAPSAEVVNAPELVEVWRDEFDTADEWIHLRGRSATVADGLMILHDAPGLAPLYCQRQPLRFGAVEIEIRLRSDAPGYVDIAVVRAVAGPESELARSSHSPLARDGVELRADWRDAAEPGGWLRWKRDEHPWYTLPTQERPLPPGEFVTVLLSIRGDGCSVAINGEPRGTYIVPAEDLRWPEAAYRIYLSCSEADAIIDSIELRPIANSPAPRKERSL